MCAPLGAFVDGGGGARTHRSFPASPAALADVRRFVREHAAQGSFNGEVMDELVLAVSEAAANSALHSDSSQILVTWRSMDGGAEVTIEDRGVFRPHREPSSRGGPGLGLQLIQALVDEVTIEEGTARRPGTTVRLVKYKR